MNAYFISPRSKIIGITEGRHIRQILREPKSFGKRLGTMIEKYREYDEEPGFEGWARNEIILGLLKKGWVRVRFEDGYLNFQIFRYDKAVREKIEKFLRLVLKGKINISANHQKYAGVRVYDTMVPAQVYVDEYNVREGLGSLINSKLQIRDLSNG